MRCTFRSHQLSPARLASVPLGRASAPGRGGLPRAGDGRGRGSPRLGRGRASPSRRGGTWRRPPSVEGKKKHDWSFRASSGEGVVNHLAECEPLRLSLMVHHVLERSPCPLPCCTRNSRKPCLTTSTEDHSHVMNQRVSF